MVKFGKQLQSELVPEWEVAYINYGLLKKDLKAIKQSGHVRDGDSVSLLGPDSTKAVKRTSSIAKVQALVAKSRQALASKLHHHDDFESFATELPERVGLDAPFFSRLDSQLNKVNQFYRTKEAEFIQQADSLEEQMQTLLEMRRRLSDRQKSKGGDSLNGAAAFTTGMSGRSEDAMEAGHFSKASTEIRRSGNESPSIRRSGNESPRIRRSSNESPRIRRSSNESPRIRRSGNESPRNDGFQPLDHHDHDHELVVRLQNIEEEPEEEMHEINTSENESPEKKNQKALRQLTMKMNIPITTPGATISAVSHSLWEDIVKQVNRSWNDSGREGSKTRAERLVVTQKNIKLAEKMLRAAFIELYRGLELLKGYSKLNMLGFAKITKKYDKISGRHANSVYLREVETSYFSTSDKVMKLIDKVDAMFTKHFAKDNHRKAMMALRPKNKRASHRTTFLLGFFLGGALFLSLVFGIFLRRSLPNYSPVDPDNRGSLPENGARVYYRTIFPTFSLVALVLLHMYMYGIDLYFWQRFRMNYAFMFGFKTGTELRHRQVFMVTSILSTVLAGSMIGHLALSNTSHSPYVDLIPLGMVMVLGILLFNPFNVFFLSSRVFFLRTLCHCLLAPLYKVTLPDFFLADQFTSQVVMLRNLQFVMCYYFGGVFRSGNSDRCLNNEVYQALTHVVALSPFWWRLMQSVRRRFDESDHHHAFNGLKYVAAMVAIGVRLEYALNRSNFWLGMLIASSTVATLFQAYWDLVVDWGLLRRHSINPWLRDELIMPNRKSVYFVSMVVNVILRLAWLQTIVRVRLFGLNEQAMDFFFGSLEVIRRGLWNFYRLENEHISNVGHFRATKAVPLPFEHHTGQDEED